MSPEPPTPPDVTAEATDFFASNPPTPPTIAAGQKFRIELPPNALPNPVTRPTIEVGRDTKFDTNPMQVKEAAQAEDAGIKAGNLKNKREVELTYEDKLEYVKTLTFGGPRFQLEVIVNPSIRGVDGNPSSIVVRDRLVIEDQITNIAVMRKLGGDRDPLQAMGWSTLLSMACQLVSYDGHDLKPFSADLDKTPEEQADNLIAAHSRMFRAFRTTQIALCFSAFDIFTKKKQACELGVGNDDFFVAPSSGPFGGQA